MALCIVTQSLALLLVATTTSQFMPPASFPYPYQQGQPQMPMMHMPNGPPMMQMSNDGSMMQTPNGGQGMQMPNGSPMIQLPNGGPMMPITNGGQVIHMPNEPLMMPHLPRLPGMPSGPMHMPMAFPMNGGRLPMVVMPHHSKKADRPRRKNRKPKRKRIKMESSSSEGSCSESVEYRRSRNKLRSSSSKHRQVLTPVVSYVTKDGFVVYQKKIKKDKARDWLEMTKGNIHDSRELKDKIRIND